MSRKKLGLIDVCLPEEEEVASTLSQLGPEWEQETGQWRTKFTWPGGMRCELVVAATDDGVQVSTILARWDGELDSDCRAALIKFFVRANARLRFARAMINGQQARVESVAPSERWERELPDRVFGVAAAFHSIAREVDALLLPEIAREYMRMKHQSNASK